MVSVWEPGTVSRQNKTYSFYKKKNFREEVPFFCKNDFFENLFLTDAF